jgi:hypothetical protein
MQAMRLNRLVSIQVPTLVLGDRHRVSDAKSEHEPVPRESLSSVDLRITCIVGVFRTREDIAKRMMEEGKMMEVGRLNSRCCFGLKQDWVC